MGGVYGIRPFRLKINIDSNNGRAHFEKSIYDPGVEV